MPVDFLLTIPNPVTIALWAADGWFIIASTFMLWVLWGHRVNAR